MKTYTVRVYRSKVNTAPYTDYRVQSEADFIPGDQLALIFSDADSNRPEVVGKIGDMTTYSMIAESYLLIEEGGYYCGINGEALRLEFGGADNEGGIDGTDAAAVANACINRMSYGILFIRDPIITNAPILWKDNILILSNTVLGGGGTIIPNITYTGTDYAIREKTESGKKNNVDIENIAIKNTNTSAKGHIRVGNCDFAQLKVIALTGYASESAINLAYSSLKGNSKELKNIRIEGEYQIATAIDCQCDWCWGDDIVISKTTNAAIKVGNQSNDEAPYNAFFIRIHGYNCQHRFLDIEWTHYLIGIDLFDEHDASWIGTKESSWYQAAGKESKSNILQDCHADFDVGAGHPPPPYTELIDNQNLTFMRADSPAQSDQSRGLKIIPRLIVDDNSRGTPNTVDITATTTDIFRLRNAAPGGKTVVIALGIDAFKLWNVTDSRMEFQAKWGTEFDCYNIVPLAGDMYDLGREDAYWRRLYIMDMAFRGVLTFENSGYLAFKDTEETPQTVLMYTGNLLTLQNPRLYGELLLAANSKILLNAPVIASANDFIPDSDETFDLGMPPRRWKELHLMDLYLYGKVFESLYPGVDNVYSLGKDDYRWSMIRAETGRFNQLQVLAGVNADWLPLTDNARALGNDSYRWSYIRGYSGKFNTLVIITTLDASSAVVNASSLQIQGTEIISSARAVHNVDLSASDLSSGTVPDARLDGWDGDVDVAKVGGGTRTLHFVKGLYKGYTDS
jgi:hypothetical protein